MPKEILLLCATREGREAFAKSAPLAASLKKLRTPTGRVASRIIYQNRHGLGTVYNRYLTARYRDKILVFVHDDVRIEDLFFVEKLDEALKAFDVVGLAGNRRPVLKHISWYDLRRPLAGFVAHPEPGRRDGTVRVSAYGPSPAECRLLDGLFLAVNTEKLVARGVKFDEQFKFYFYDLDFSLICLAKGLKLGTWPLWAVHQSGGAFTTPGWQREAELYRRKWQLRP